MAEEFVSRNAREGRAGTFKSQKHHSGVSWTETPKSHSYESPLCSSQIFDQAQEELPKNVVTFN